MMTLAHAFRIFLGVRSPIFEESVGFKATLRRKRIMTAMRSPQVGAKPVELRRQAKRRGPDPQWGICDPS
jgi:hypothetical protein